MGVFERGVEPLGQAGVRAEQAAPSAQLLVAENLLLPRPRTGSQSTLLL